MKTGIFRIGLFVSTCRRDFNKVQSAFWIRAFQMVPYLRKLRIEVHINNPLHFYDIAVFHRGMGKLSFQTVRVLKKMAERLYWDTCVDYFEEHEAASHEQVYYSKKIAESVDGVITTTEGIAHKVARYNDNVFVMPDPIDTHHFDGWKREVNWDKPVFGWSGVSVKSLVLKPYAEVLRDNLILISEKKVDLPFQYEFVRWNYERFPEDLLRADIAFLPRKLDSTYSVNNSSFKALVFAAQGIPIIANRLPSYELLSRDYGAIAFLEDHSGVDQAISYLKMRSRKVEAVRREYSCDRWAERLRDFFIAELNRN